MIAQGSAVLYRRGIIIVLRIGTRNYFRALSVICAFEPRTSAKAEVEPLRYRHLRIA